MEQNPKLVLPGNSMCPGCGAGVVEKLIMDILGKNTILFGCATCSDAHARNLTIPHLQLHFSGVGAGAAGVAAALDAKNRTGIKVVSFSGDGGTADIGFGKIAACAERGDNILHFCLDNEAYMNTGNQTSHLTPYGAYTTTTPLGKPTRKKNIEMVMAYHYIPYIATMSMAHTSDFTMKVKKAAAAKGFRFMHAMITCPTGWGYSPEKSVEIAKLAVESRMWNLFEIENGVLRITRRTRQVPVREYLKLQKRFAHLTEQDMDKIQKDVDEAWEALQRMDNKNLWRGMQPA